MPHATTDVVAITSNLPTHPKSKAKLRSRESKFPSNQLEEYQSLYKTSQLTQTIDRQLRATLKNARTPITKVLSLGLGSLVVAKGQSRRLKQLTILLAIRNMLQELSGTSIQIFAQDPSFTRNDESILHGLGIRILRTRSGSELGEAASALGAATIVYSPFLTLEIYEQLLVHHRSVHYLVGDDFDFLLPRWPKKSAERVQVECVVKRGLAKGRRRAVAGGGFWTEEDQTFPMAMYKWSDDGTA